MDRPLLIDGPRTAAFVQDEAECRALVEQGVLFDADGTVLGSTVGGAAGSAIFGGDAGDIVAGAAVGMITGAIAAEQKKGERQRSALIRCLRGRGHPVFG